MPRVDSIETQIANVEGFKVKFCHVNGRDVRADKDGLPSYPYQKAAWNESRVAQWREQRFRTSYPDYGVRVLLADGTEAHGGKMLATVRDSYREEQQSDEIDATEIPDESIFVRETVEGATKAVWVVRAGYAGDEEPIALENDVATIHWNELDDLSGIESKDALAEMYQGINIEETPAQQGMAVCQVWAFRSQIKKGDLVILPLVRMWHALAVGEVTGPYAFRNDLGNEVLHTLPVEWLVADLPRSRLDSVLSKAISLPRTVYRIRKPADAEQRFRAILCDEIDRRQRRMLKNYPPIKANIIHKDGTHSVRLHSLPREGEYLRLCLIGVTEPLCFKVDYVVHDIGEERDAHAIKVHVSEGDEEEAKALNKMLQLAQQEANRKRAALASETEATSC